MQRLAIDQLVGAASAASSVEDSKSVTVQFLTRRNSGSPRSADVGARRRAPMPGPVRGLSPAGIRPVASGLHGRYAGEPSEALHAPEAAAALAMGLDLDWRVRDDPQNSRAVA